MGLEGEAPKKKELPLPGRPRLKWFLFLVVVSMLAPSTAIAVPDPQIQLTFEFPDGTPMSDATVGVLWVPFQAPNAYVSPILAGGVTLSDGTFGFNLETDDALDQFKEDLETKYNEAALPLMEEVPVGGLPDLYAAGSDLPWINVAVNAVDPDHTWLAAWNLALPLDGTYGETITANVDLSALPAAAGLSSQTLAGLDGNVTTCMPNDEPDGFDAMLLDIEDEVGAGSVGGVGNGDTVDPNRICAASIQPTSPEPGADSTGLPIPTPNECQPLTTYTCLAGTKTRWTKVAEMHSAPGLYHDFLYDEGRDTQTEVALKAGDGGGWQIGGWAWEGSSRDTMASVHEDGNYHRERFMQYVFHKYRSCSYHFIGGYFCTDQWRPSFWTGGWTKRSKTAINQPSRDKAHSIKVGVGGRWTTTTTRQWGFGIGVRLGPINLGAQAGFSNATQLSWAGTEGCGSSRWLWGGGNKWPIEAGRIYAICEPA